MQERISHQDFHRLGGKITKHLLALGAPKFQSKIDPKLVHLITLRVSQINGCAYCQHMHAAEARGAGENQQRLDVLPAWREAPGFSELERSGLAWAEALTNLNHSPVCENTFAEALDCFGQVDLLELTAIILAINSWNRVAVSLRFQPEIIVN